MNGYSLLSLLSFIIIFFLGNFVYYQRQRDNLHLFFALYCLFMSLNAFAEFMVRQAGSLATAFFWLRISAVWPISLAFLLHFTLIFTRRFRFLKSGFSYVLIYLPMVLSSMVIFFEIKPLKQYWGYSYIRSPLMANLGVFAGCYGLACLALCLYYYFTLSDPLRKKQVKVIMVGQLCPAFFSMMSEAWFRGLIPELSITGATIFAVFTVYAIWKYQLFVIDPATTAENILKTMPNSLILINEAGAIQEVNPSLLQLLGYEKSALIGKPVTMIFAQGDPVSERLGAQPPHEGTIPNFETCFQTSHGALIPVSFAASAIKNQQGRPVGMVGIGTDLRRLKQLQAHLFQSEKMAAIGQLAGGVAHEINNPLGVILGFAQSIVKRVPDNDSLHPPLQSIEREAVRCKKLIGDLLTFSQSGKTHPEPIDINQTIDEALLLINIGTKIPDIEIVRNYGPDIPIIIAHKNQIQQVIINICNNAIDAMQNGGKLTLTTQSADKQIEIIIRDTGPGITAEVKKHIFEPFYTTKEIGKGTGLGLSISYEIIAKHRGSITVESEAGKGAAFIIKLPGKTGLIHEKTIANCG